MQNPKRSINNVIHRSLDVLDKPVPWYHRIQFADVYGSDIDNRFFIQAFTMLALEDHKTFVTSQFEGLLNGGNEKVKGLLADLFKDRGGFIAAQYVPFNNETNNYRNWQFFWDEGVVTVTYSDDDSSVTIFALNEQDRDEIVKVISPITAKKRSAGKAYVMVSSSNGLQLKSLGNSEKVVFESENYSEDTVNKYKYAVEQLKSSKPNGRILILRGAPGCGKSYLIRAFVGEVEHATFIIVPSAMVASLDGPDVLSTLINTYSNADGPICIILEDADSVLAPRKADNMHSISTLLNVSDGILGQLLDLRIICTTNALQEELDPAVVRDGRLCVDMEFDALPYEQATVVLKRILDNPDAVLPEDRPYTLAQIYKLARPDSRTDIKLTSAKRQTMGFTDDEDEDEVQVHVLSPEEVRSRFGDDLQNEISGKVIVKEVDGNIEFDPIQGGPTVDANLSTEVDDVGLNQMLNNTKIKPEEK